MEDLYEILGCGVPTISNAWIYMQNTFGFDTKEKKMYPFTHA
jgi:spore maturation protein CgeB